MADLINHEGYEFAGWYVDEACTRRLNPGGVLPGEIRLYPKWKPITYPVYYDLEEGVNSEYNPHEVSIESEVRKLYPARCKGRQFAGWFLDGRRVEYLEEALQHPVHLKGIFQDPVCVSFDTGGGARLPAQTVDACGHIVSPPTPFKIGYEFKGWYQDPGMIFSWHPDTVFLNPSTLYASWSLKEYTIRYDLDGGTFKKEPPKSFTHLSPTFLLPQAHKAGYDFGGWLDERGNQQLLIRKGSLNDRHYRAHWIPRKGSSFRIGA